MGSRLGVVQRRYLRGFTSSVHLLRNRLLGGGARIVAISGFGCDFSAV
jgi:hypothetical protein